MDNLSDCLMRAHEKFQVSTGLEPVSSAMPVYYSNQLSYETTQMWAGQFVGLKCSTVQCSVRQFIHNKNVAASRLNCVIIYKE